MSPAPVDTAGGAMDDRSFAAIAQIAKDEAGLVLPMGKMTMVQSRLRKRLIATGQPDYKSYCSFVTSSSGQAELREMISALTTNVSHFFRESHHFDILRTRVLPVLLERARAGHRVRIWSAGCSSGQEPYSISICLQQAAPELANRDVLILGTDIDPAILEKAEAGIYSEQQIAGIPDDQRRAYLEPADQPGMWRVNAACRRLVRFRELNLLRDWPMKGRFDVIFCRNVVIYFDAPTQASLWPRFRGVLADNGWMFLGHSERISDSSLHLFTPNGMTAYQAASGIPAPAAPKKKD